MVRNLTAAIVAMALIGGMMQSASAARYSTRNVGQMMQKMQQTQATQLKAQQEQAAKVAAVKAAVEAKRKEMHHQATEARRESAKAAGKREIERRNAQVLKKSK